MDDKNILLLVDGNALLFRTFFAMRNARHKDVVSSSFIFFKSINSVIEKIRPTHMLVAFDLPTPTFRHNQFKEYKQNRPPTPEDLIKQIPIVKELLTALQIPQLEVAGYEADDIIATHAFIDNKTNVVVHTSDFDLMQLVSDTVSVLLPKINKNGVEFINKSNFHENYMLFPHQVPDYKGIAGDSSDNLPGVKGIGEIGAKKLLSKYHSLDGIYKNIAELSPLHTNKLTASKAIAYKCKELATLYYKVPQKMGLKQLNVVNYDPKTALSFFKARKWNSLVNKYSN